MRLCAGRELRRNIMTSALARRTEPVAVRAEIDFLVPGVERPFVYAHEAPAGAEAETVRFESRAVLIQDLRDAEPLRIDEHGAELGTPCAHRLHAKLGTAASAA